MMTNHNPITLPKHSTFYRIKETEVTNKLIKLGCKIIEEKDVTLKIQVPDTWFFTTNNKTYCTAFFDKERTQEIFTIKQNVNTGRYVTQLTNEE